MQINCEDVANFEYEKNTPEKREDFQLLAYISSLVSNQTFVILGSHPEQTEKALSHNKKNRVITYSTTPFSMTNGRFPIIVDNLFQDVFKNSNRFDEILQSSLIYVDIHPHEGRDEFAIFELLRDAGYKGVILFDDIWHFKTMRDNCWYRIPEDLKQDLTDVGHWSGTGIVSFTGLGILPQKPRLDNWTLVTAYFNLTKCPDATPEIHQRDKKYYFEHSISTLSLPYNMIIYCDEESFPMITQIRPVALAKKTQYVILPFDSFVFKGKRADTFAQYREIIAENRIKYPYEFDPRNTPSYYLFCMARYIMLKQVVTKNPFGSTQFAWINFCMERMGISNIRRLPEAMAVNREKFSTCYIDYIPESFVRNTEQYFKRGHCSMCSGFFTGNGEYMYRVCDAMENKFLHYLDLGRGHADETLYPSVYFDDPSLFEHYYGDYQEMITNYVWIYERAENPLRNFIANSFQCGDYERCFRACSILWKSYQEKKCVLTQEQVEKLCFYYMMSRNQAPAKLI
jgi:hypothetical protein